MLHLHGKAYWLSINLFSDFIFIIVTWYKVALKTCQGKRLKKANTMVALQQ